MKFIISILVIFLISCVSKTDKEKLAVSENDTVLQQKVDSADKDGILVDTVLTGIGPIRVQYDQNILKIISHDGAGELELEEEGFLDAPLDGYSNRLIHTLKDGRWSKHNILYGDDVLFFVLRKANKMPVFYAARFAEDEWKFLCLNDSSSCSIFSRSPSCVVWQQSQSQILIFRGDVGYDRGRNVDYQYINVYSCGQDNLIDKGRLKIEGIDRFDCIPEDINRWFTPFNKLGDTSYYNIYIEVLPR